MIFPVPSKKVWTLPFTFILSWSLHGVWIVHIRRRANDCVTNLLSVPVEMRKASCWWLCCHRYLLRFMAAYCRTSPLGPFRGGGGVSVWAELPSQRGISPLSRRMTGPCPLHYADRTRTEPLYSMGRSNRKGLHPIQPTGQMASVSPYVCFQRILGIGCPAGFGGHMFADFCLPIEDNGWPNRVRLKNGQADPIGPVVWKGPKTTNPTINDDSKRGEQTSHSPRLSGVS